MRTTPPFRADHVGSLLRPRALKDAFRAHARGTLDEAALEAAIDAAVREAVALQEDAGLRSITDGEFRRTAWSTGLVAALDGLDERPSLFEFRDDTGDVVRWNTCSAVARIRRRRGITTAEHAHVRALTDRTPKVTIPAPSFLHFFRAGRCAEPAAYPDPEAFWSDLLSIYRDELADLGRAGATYLQIDEVPLAMLCDPEIRDALRGLGADPDALVERYVAAIGAILAGRPAGLTVAMHLCRGNLRGHWMASGGYEAIAERLFARAPVDAFFLEFDSPRAGDFAPLRFVPPDKTVVLGLVSTKTPALEDRDALRRRIDAAAKIVPLERLALSPQCGFASTAGGNPLTVDDERRKLELVVGVARQTWGEA